MMVRMMVDERMTRKRKIKIVWVRIDEKINKYLPIYDVLIKIYAEEGEEVVGRKP